MVVCIGEVTNSWHVGFNQGMEAVSGDTGLYATLVVATLVEDFG